VNLSGLGVVRGSDGKEQATELMEFLLQPKEQKVFEANNHEFAVADCCEFKRDTIDVASAGKRLDEALNLMDQVGWD
jgi:ABC-type Fe3+ transport system substrate-binding protein